MASVTKARKIHKQVFAKEDVLMHCGLLPFLYEIPVLWYIKPATAYF